MTDAAKQLMYTQHKLMEKKEHTSTIEFLVLGFLLLKG
jgi:hypothetical protein